MYLKALTVEFTILESYVTLGKLLTSSSYSFPFVKREIIISISQVLKRLNYFSLESCLI